MAVKAKPKTREERLAERRAELDVMAQMQLQADEQRAAQEAEQNAFLLAVQQRRDAVARGVELEPPVIPTITGIYVEKHAQDMAEAERLEAERIASLTPRDIWLSTRSLSERNSIARWEQINGMPYPVPGEAVEA
jgi:hypothetical protein